jgi:hypothetical protein
MARPKLQIDDIFWKQVPEWPSYWVSNYGEIKRVYKGGKEKILQQSIMKRYDREVLDDNFYRQVSFSKDGKVKKYLVHRIIAETLMRRLGPGECVNHKDGRKYNNHPSNLEIVSEKENKEHAAKNGLMQRGSSRPNSKLTEQEILDIRCDTRPHAVIAKKYMVDVSVISRIKNRKTWKHV